MWNRIVVEFCDQQQTEDRATLEIVLVGANSIISSVREVCAICKIQEMRDP